MWAENKRRGQLRRRTIEVKANVGTERKTKSKKKMKRDWGMGIEDIAEGWSV